MLKSALVGAFALTIFSLVPEGQLVSQAVAQDVVDATETTGAIGPVVTEAKIARLKRALRLTAAQEPHWHPVESALRRVAQTARRDGNSGLVQRVRAKVSGYAANASHFQQVTSAAGPLIASLDDKQKQDGIRLIREFGFSGN
jgi:hypothetical protein